MKNKIDLLRKLTSRKFWLAVAGFVSGICISFSGSAELAETISGYIMSGSSIVAYIIGEAITDTQKGGNKDGS